MSPKLLEFHLGTSTSDPFDTYSILLYKLTCSDGKKYGKGVKLPDGGITNDVLQMLSDSINKTWEEHSLVSK